jgi:hypothetical protein
MFVLPARTYSHILGHAMKGNIAAPIFLLAISCAAQNPTEAPPEQAFLESAMKWPTYFGISSSERAELWTRARTWAEQYGNGTLTVLSDNEITAIRAPVGSEGARTLRITSSETFGGFRINVDVIAHRKEEVEEAARIAHLLAYSLASGRTIPEELVSL